MGVLAPGTILGGCRIEAVVGRGGMGIVYRARQLDLDRDVAVKVIAPELVEDEQTRARFLTEARAAGAVEHPNVVPVHGVGVGDGQAYLVMRYVAGDDLRTLVRRDGPLAPRHAAEVAAQLGDALDAIHRAGYVHRDVKPQNIMVGANGHVYLSDFGLAKEALATSGPTTSEHWVGTLDYVAPEQIRGQPVDARSDVYALGGVVFFMLTGRVPFERGNDEAKLWAHLHDPPPRPSAVRTELPADLDAVVERAMAKDPGERPDSAGELAAAVAAVAEGRPPPTVAARTRPTVRAPARARRRPWRVGAALGLLVAAAAAVWLLARDGDRGPGVGPVATARPGPSATPSPPAVGETFRPVGERPRGVLVAGGGVWVLSIHEQRIARLDADTGRRLRVQPFVGRGAASIAGAGDVVWVAKPPTGNVLGLDARGGDLVRTVPVPLPPRRVAAGPSGLWVAAWETADGPAVLYRFDPAGEQLLGETAFPDGITAITLGAGAAWVALTGERRVMRVAPGRPAQHGAWLAAPAGELAYGAGRVWASIPTADSVARIDPGGRPTITTAVGRRPAGLAVADGRLYVASNTRHRLEVLDPDRIRRGAEQRLRMPPNPYAVAAGAGHVWVTGMGANTLTRIDY